MSHLLSKPSEQELAELETAALLLSLLVTPQKTFRMKVNETDYAEFMLDADGEGLVKIEPRGVLERWSWDSIVSALQFNDLYTRSSVVPLMIWDMGFDYHWAFIMAITLKTAAKVLSRGGEVVAVC